MTKIAHTALALALALTSGSVLAARPVAKWDVVPHQRVTGVFQAGVVAFHEKLEKVVFTVNGAEKFTATKRTDNRRTRVNEFVFPFDAKAMKDGPVKLGAIVYATGEAPFRLPELPLYANGKGTQGSSAKIWVDPVNGNDYSDGSAAHPVKTLKSAIGKAGDGGTICLMKGLHNVARMGGGAKRKFWTTIEPAPGTSTKDIRVKGGRTGSDRIRFRNLQLFCEQQGGQGYVLSGADANSVCWLDNCSVSNTEGRHGGVAYVFGNKLSGYVTGGTTRDIAYGPCARIVRNHAVKCIAADAFSANDCLVVNSRIEDVDPQGLVSDPAVWRCFPEPGGWVHDVILFNVNGEVLNCHGLLGRKVRDSAFVNVKMESTNAEKFWSRFSEEMENCYFKGDKIVGQRWDWYESANGVGNIKPVDVRVDDCSFEAISTDKKKE